MSTATLNPVRPGITQEEWEKAQTFYEVELVPNVLDSDGC